MRYLLLLSLFSCSFIPQQNSADSVPNENTIKDLHLPIGFKRKVSRDTLFASFLANIKLKDNNTVKLYNGENKGNQNAHYRVLNLGVGNKDLQQCADAVIRLRAEYLYHQKRYSEIKFHFTSGHLCKYSDYTAGYRPKIKGSNVEFIKSAQADTSLVAFKNYLDLIFTYCGTASLFKELKPKSIKNIEPGDVFIQTGNPYGHAIMVMDVAINDKGETIFLLAQSYMPAQEIHILKNPTSEGLSPWFLAKDGELITPEWSFQSTDLKSW